MFRALALVTLVTSAFAHNAFNKVLLKGEDIDTLAAPTFLDEALKLSEFQHMSVKDRLAQNLNFPFLVHLTAEAMQENSLGDLQERLGGVDLSHYIPHNTFLVFTTHLNALELSKDAQVVDWIGNLHPEHKLSDNIIKFDPERMALNELIVEIAPQDFDYEAEQTMLDLLNRASEYGFTAIEGKAATKSRFNLRLGNLQHVELAEFLSHQPEVVHIHRNFPEEIANAFAKTIVWEGKEAPEMSNSELRTTRNKLDGKGQVVGVADSGLARHSCFLRQDTFNGSTAYKMWSSNATDGAISCASDFDDSNRKIVQYVGFADYADSNSDLVGHGTHVTGSIVGSLEAEHGDSELSHFQGMAPEAKVAFFDVGLNSTGALSMPEDLQAGVLNWAYLAKARVHSNSWGKSGGWFGNSYDSSSRDMDEFMWTHKDFLVVVAAGNQGGCNSRNSVGSPGNAKNVLTVGATLNSHESWKYLKNHISEDSLVDYFWSKNPSDFSSETVAAFSSIGPTEDNRIKPDVTAPGYYITSAFNSGKDTQCDSPVFMQTIRMEAGTSQATPQVSGSALLVRQYFMEGFFPSGTRNEQNAFSPSASLVKAVIINSAVNMKGVKHQLPYGYFDFCSIERFHLTARPSITQGFGRMSLDSVLAFANEPTARSTFIPSLNASAADVFFDSSVSTGQVHTFKYCTKAGSVEELRVTLVWTDAPPSLLSSRKLVNDLDLTVQVGSSNLLYGNAQGSYRNEVRTFASSSSKDEVNPVESVYYTPSSSAQSATVVVTVSGFNVPQGPQPYSLVISGALSEGECGSGVVSEPAIRQNSVLEVPAPSSACRNVYAIDDSEDASSETPAPTYSYPTYDTPTYSPYPSHDPYWPAPSSGVNKVVIIVCSVVGSFVLVAIVVTVLILRRPNEAKKPLLQQAQTPSRV